MFNNLKNNFMHKINQIIKTFKNATRKTTMIAFFLTNYINDISFLSQARNSSS